MTAKEKAKQLVYMYWDVEDIDFSNSIKCALIAVDELLQLRKGYFDCINPMQDEKYWQEVKQEIEKL